MERVLFASLNAKAVFARVRPAFGDGTSSLIGLSGLRTILRLGSSLILTRLLVPEAYGVVAILAAIIYILNMLSDLGLAAFITRHKTADDKLLETVWTVRFLRNIVLGAVMFFGADIFAQLYANPDIALAIRVMASIFLIGAFSSLAFETGQRERRVLRISFIEFGQFLIITSVTLVAAYYLRTYWASVIGIIAGAFYLALASYFLIPARPVRFRLDRDHLIDLWRFSRYIIPSSMISIVLMQADKFLVANFFPLAELGKYMLAATITQAVTTLIVDYNMRVFFPLMSQLERDDPSGVLQAFYDSRMRLTLLLAFGIGGLIGGGTLVVQILFNDLYLTAGLYLSIVSLACLGRLITQPAIQALVAKGYVRIVLIANLWRLVWLAVSTPVAYHFSGPLGIVVAIALTEASIIPYLWWRQQGQGIFNLAKEVMILGAAGVGVLIGYAAYRASDALIALGYLPKF